MPSSSSNELVRRLREGDLCYCAARTPDGGYGAQCAVCRAADEIERLRAALDRAGDATSATCKACAEVCGIVDTALDGLHHETKASPQAPIVSVRIFRGMVVEASQYAPGLPDGTHELYCEANRASTS
jgi:hypothetical protein